MNSISKIRNISSLYMDLKREVISSGFYYEIDWQDSISFDCLSEQDFLREAAWVILSSGMKETIISKKFDSISDAFCNWESAEKIVVNSELCIGKALRSFNNIRKIKAINDIARIIELNGFGNIKKAIAECKIDYLKTFPFIGNITAYHLAKNIGLDVSKPDRHLVRIAEKAGYENVKNFCDDISECTGDKVSVVDLVFWRYATLDKEYLKVFEGI